MKRLLVVLISCLLFLESVYAAGSFSVTSSSKTIAPGGKFTITVKSSGIGRVNISVSNGSSNEKSFWIEENSKKITIVAGKSGTVNVTITTEEGFSDSSGNIYNPGTKRINVPIVEKRVESTTKNKTNTTTKTTITTNTSKEIKLHFEDSNIIIKDLNDEDFDPNFKKISVEIDDIVYKTINLKEDNVLILDKNNDYYIYDIKTNEIISRVLPLNLGRNTYYLESSLNDRERYSKEQIELLDKKIDAYRIKDGYYLVRAWNHNGEVLEYIYEKEESTLQLYHENLFSCDNHNTETNYNIYLILVGVLIIFGIILAIIFRRK